MRGKRPSKDYKSIVICEMFVTLVALFGVWSQWTSIKRPLESKTFWMTIIVGLFTIGTVIWAFVSYMRARKHEQSH
ncbi:hypothetical protein KDA_18300 [Dictyobacter alpinus]|uniref:Uncharacterized protein n=1 Tax=Dictyobacter alpinus TaxID=2014873 RepID=A0A402B4S5_9CHLR|nr:hypothetical protein KDA_18300 [Dictyobacter alpinus]